MTQIFISKSGGLPDADKWLALLNRSFSTRYRLVVDTDFRPAQDPITYHESWLDQFNFTRASDAMIVLTDPKEWVSLGQITEIEDVLGRRMPVANCRTSPLQNKDENRYFDHLLKFGNRQYKWFLNSFFDLCSDDVELELCRLTAWIDKVATAPLQLPYSFKSNQTSAFRVRISVPDGDGQKDIDWSTCPALPILVFNYGERLVYNENRARSTWDWPEHRQVVFPVSPTGIPGELEGEISLPCEGFGHALLTLGEPATRHKAKTEDLFLWWDFFVDIY